MLEGYSCVGTWGREGVGMEVRTAESRIYSGIRSPCDLVVARKTGDGGPRTGVQPVESKNTEALAPFKVWS